jgi:hypothetical protein
MESTIKIKDYTCTRTLIPNGTTTYHCTCPAWVSAKKRGVPCKHILSSLFTNCDVAKWEEARKRFAKESGKNQNDAEMFLAIGLRMANPKVCDWFTGFLTTGVEQNAK